MQSSKQGMRKGDLFREKGYIKRYVVGPQGGASPYKHLLSTPRAPDIVLDHTDICI